MTLASTTVSPTQEPEQAHRDLSGHTDRAGTRQVDDVGDQRSAHRRDAEVAGKRRGEERGTPEQAGAGLTDRVRRRLTEGARNPLARTEEPVRISGAGRPGAER